MILEEILVIRVLNVVGGMNRGGIETWLMNVLRHVDRDHFKIDFLVHTTEPGIYDYEIRELGSQIFPCTHPSKPWIYASNFQKILCEHGSYDIIHSHVHHFNGYVLYLAKKIGIPVRIAHTHTDTSSKDSTTGLPRRLYLSLMQRWIARYATLGLGASSKAAIALFGSINRPDFHWQTFYCGVNLEAFHSVVDPVDIRYELGIPADAFVIGHVGRFVEPKNHIFLIEIAAEIVKYEPKVRLLLVGDGPLRSEIEAKVEQLGLTNIVIFAGMRSDVPQLMLGAMDVFLLPSLYEGLGLVLIEAQAAGLPCIFSDVVPEEASIVKPLIKKLPLSYSASKWAQVILKERNSCLIDQENALRFVKSSPFNIELSFKELEVIYKEQIAKSLNLLT